MKRTIRLAACISMAVASGPVFADGSHTNSTDTNQQPTHQMKTDVMTSDHQDVGRGSGEPGVADTHAMTDEREAKKEAKEAALQEYNQQRFLNETWTLE